MCFVNLVQNTCKTCLLLYLETSFGGHVLWTDIYFSTCACQSIVSIVSRYCTVLYLLRYPSITESIPPEYPSLRKEFSKMEDMIITRYYSPEDKLFKYHIWAFIFDDFNDNNDAGPTVPARLPLSCPMPTTGEQQERLGGGGGVGILPCCWHYRQLRYDKL